MLNLLSMIIMAVLVLGILIIFVVTMIKGSQSVDPMIMGHVSVAGIVLGLNIYVLTLEDT